MCKPEQVTDVSAVGYCAMCKPEQLTEVSAGGYFEIYHGLAICTQVSFVDAPHAQMSGFVIEVCL